MAQDLLTTYKYGWKTSYYQNTYDFKTDEVEDTKESLDNLITQLENAEEEDCESCKNLRQTMRIDQWSNP